MPLCFVLAAALAGSENPPSVSWYVPRQASAGAFFNGALIPSLRVSLEPELIENPRDQMIAVLELGLGLGAPALPDQMSTFYETTLTLGGGYRYNGNQGLHWGFHIGTGPILYGARFKDGSKGEDRLTGTVEGSAQIGFRVGQVSWGLQLRYAEPYDVYARSVAAKYIGGFYLGIVANWR
jgi:hypothetical protein